MVIHDLDVQRPGRSFRPLEANPPLPVDADAELPGTIALQSLKVVARQGAQIVQAGCGLQNFQPLVALSGKPLKLTDELAGRKRFRPPVSVAQNHAAGCTLYVRRRQECDECGDQDRSRCRPTLYYLWKKGDP
jgi:hypothetical protein